MTSLLEYLQPIGPSYGDCDGYIWDLESILRGVNRIKCSRSLHAPYYVAYDDLKGFLFSDPCKNPDDEAIQTAKLEEFIKCRAHN